MTLLVLSGVLAAGVTLGLSIGYLVGWVRGFRRGRDVERMEPPRHGVMHCRDGYPFRVYADSTTDAFERVARIGGKAW